MRSLLRTPFFLALIILVGAGCHRKPPLSGVRATWGAVETTVAATTAGTVEAVQEAVLGFSAGGRVREVRIREGDTVKRGQILAEQENAELRSALRDAANELSRAKQLFRARLISQATRDEAQSNLDRARAALDRTLLIAPFAGLVAELNLEVGSEAFPGSGTPALKLVDLLPRRILGTLDELDLGKVRPGQAARIRLPALSNQTFPGHVVRIIPYVNPAKEQDRTAQVELALESLEASRSVPVGASADIEIIIERKEKALILPTRTLIGVGAGRRALVLNDGKVKRVPLKTGLGNYDRTEAKEGIAEGDTLIYPPEDRELRDGEKVKIEVKPWP